jgi:uncharacterized protein (TIGR02391 family)
MASPRLFEQTDADAIARALGDTHIGLSGPEIGHLLSACGMSHHDPGAGITKWKRIQIAFANDQNSRRDRTGILAFIRRAMRPSMHLSNPQRFEHMRHQLNKALAFAELGCDEAGKLHPVQAATTLSEAEKRASALRAGLERRGVHPEILRFCQAEWLADDYFHAALEATKSVADRIRKRTGLLEDGAVLVDRAFGGDKPMLVINQRSTKSERDEQSGFCNLLKGLFGMFRNPTAHEARINWHITEEDAEDLMSLASLIHRRLDSAIMPPRV